MDSNSWEELLRKRYCEKEYYVLPYEGETEENDVYEWEYDATDEYLCGYFSMRIYYNPKTRRVIDFECERFDEECYGGRPLMDDGNVTRIQQKAFTDFFKSWTTKSAKKAGSVPDDEQQVLYEPFAGKDLEYECLVKAILSEDINGVKQYLTAAAYPYKSEYEGRIVLPMYAAVKVNRKDICELLVENGADPNPLYTTPEGRFEYLIVSAFRMGSVSSAEYLLSTGRIKNIANLQNSIFKELVIKGPHIVDEFIRLFEVGYFKSMDLVEVPIFDWFDTLDDKQLQRVFYSKVKYFKNAAFDTYYDLVDHIMKKRSNTIFDTLKIIASEHLETQLALMGYFAKIRDFETFCEMLNNYPCEKLPVETFHKLFKRGRKWVARLIDNGFDIDQDYGKLLKIAYSHRNDSEVDALLALGANPALLTQNGDTWDSIGWGLKAHIEQYYTKHPKIRKPF